MDTTGFACSVSGVDGAAVMLDPDVTTSRAAEPTADEAVSFATGLGLLEGRLWQAPGVDGPAPLLVVHDGPAYAGEGRLLDYLTRLAAGRLERAPGVGVRALLLTAPDRDAWYSANGDYAAALAEAVGEITTAWPTTFTVGAGASLGALAALHAQWNLGLFDGLLLQSGSFFTPDTDPQEEQFAHWEAVVGFVSTVQDEVPARPLPPVAMTCGADEENIHNNRLMAARLAELADVGYVEAHAIHNFVAWRDALHPSLTELLTKVIARTAPPHTRVWPTIDP